MIAALLTLLALLLAAFVAWRFWYFHRNPPRTAPPGRDPVCPADGRILYIEQVELRPDAPDPYHRRVQQAFGVEGAWQVIATYLGILDVHVVRAPVAGRLRLVPIDAIGANVSMGQSFLYAALRRPLPLGQRGYLEKNEFLGVEIRGEQTVLLVLMADWWIDQIVPLVDDGIEVQRGQVIGRIQMGSQVDLWAPAGTLLPLRQVGERTAAGSSVIARVA